MFRKTLASDQEHLVISQYDAYQDRALTEAETTVYRQHLDTCSECRTWVENQVNIARQLANEAPAPAILSPAAAARIQQNVFSKMRRALIMNNVRTVTGAAVAFAVLALVVGTFVWQSRTLDTIDFVAQVPGFEAAAPVTDEQLIEAVNAKDAAAVEQLLKAGANANALDSSGDPMLKTAILRGQSGGSAEIVELLLAHGADTNALDKGGNALLAFAAGPKGQVEIVQLLLDAGADVNGTLTGGSHVQPLIDQSALNEAAYNNNIEIVELLIAHGADVNLAEKNYNWTALDGAAYYDYPEIIRVLLENGADPNPLNTWGVGGTPLHIAAELRHVAAAQELLDGGADVDLQDGSGLTPMMVGIKDGGWTDLTKIVTLFLDRGADPNLQAHIGNAALHYAAREGKNGVIPILIENGASVDLQNNVGNTALHEAAKRSQFEAITLLIENGASLDIKNNKDQTALDVAIDDRVIELLQEASAAE
jgi:ankyrin repeat protein